MDRLKIVLFYIFLLAVFFKVTGCKQDSPTLFERMSDEHTGIDFVNTVKEGPGNNILESEFFYNGAGVAVGDINNDGYTDIYFTANEGSNALYLNLANFQFEDITRKAGLSNSDTSGWSAGTSMADINGDGLLDIYVCKAGDVEKEERRNKLYINNGDLTFTESAEKYGLDDSGYCTQAAFFDYDIDGDLDAFITNYSVKRTFTGSDLNTIRNEYEPGSADKLFRNDNNRFVDVSREAGIIQNPLGFGLSATVSDLTQDGWPDIYVANDFIERDYMYINQGDGTFKDQVLARTELISYFSMGSDIADVNNDGLPDILVVDMLPYDYSRRRVFKTPDYSLYEQLAPVYHRKNMRNVLQLNNGNGTFTEVGQLAGISKTDWSWAPLLADFDNDGMKDVFITNGFPRFYTDLDYLNKVLWKKYPNENYPDDPELRYDLVRQMQEVELQNFAFRNMGDLAFEAVSQAWGVSQYAVSNGAAYADLDNNGTLDLIVNNINESPFILQNTAREQNRNNFLRVRLRGDGKNTFGIGAKVTVTGRDGSVFYQENFPVRGYQSSVDPVLLFGLGNRTQVNVEVVWPNQTRQRRENISANQTLTLVQAEADISDDTPDQMHSDPNSGFVLLDQVKLGLDFKHLGSPAGDRDISPLMPHTRTNLGPALASGDINGDGLQDLFMGGGQGQAASLYLQQINGRFARYDVPAFEQHKAYQDVGAKFFDVTGNGLLDLYVVSGGSPDPIHLCQDRLYINDGSGNFIFVSDALPRMESCGGTVTTIEIDGDGDADLFVGGRNVTNQYPIAPRSYILENRNGAFTDVTEQVSPALLFPGMVADSEWADLNSNDRPELIIAGEWMPIRIFELSKDQKLIEITDEAGLEKTAGWWNVLKVADFDGDGHKDLIAGNRGLNFALSTTPEEPVVLYAGDFNKDGIVDPILTQVIDGARYPVPDRDRLLQQLPQFLEKFPDYTSYATATIEEVLSSRQLKNADKFEVHTFASAVFRNNGDGTFQTIPLLRQAQVAPIYDIILDDFNEDGVTDILAAGNNYGTPSGQGPVADQGILLTGDGAFDFTPVKAKETGFIGVGEVRELELLKTQIGPLIVLGRYADSILLFLN